MKQQHVTVGGVINYFDPYGKPIPSFVTAVWGETKYDEESGELSQAPTINVVFVSKDEERGDTYGRQIERETSVVHRRDQHAHGNFWDWID